MGSKVVSRASTVPALIAGLLYLVSGMAAAQNALPVPCAGNICGAGNPEVFVTSGDAVYETSGAVGTIRQFSDRAILNWQSFDVAPGNRVVFEQPRDISVALNRIYQQSPSEILGAVDANGQIYLVNPNGFIFGKDARVNTNTLLASSLNIEDAVFENSGLIGALNQGGGVAALTANTDNAGEILIEQGALLETREGGQILIFAPRIVNAGELRTPGGQTLLAASEDRVFLQFSEDPSLRGFLVEVSVGGEVENLGQIVAERGNVTVAGILIEQQGVVQATTTVQENGSIRLLARDGVSVQPIGGRNELRSTNTGALVLGADSLTTVLPDLASADTGVDAQAQTPSSIELMGRSIVFEDSAAVRAPGGRIVAQATAVPARPLTIADASTELRIGDDVVIDASGVDSVVLPMARNFVEVDLRSNELADSPLQRDGAARGETVSIDIRRGSTFANVQDAISNVQRGIGERLAPGGEVLLGSEGELSVGAGTRIDVAGGAVTYEAGFVQSSQVVLEDGRIVDLSEADPEQEIASVFSGAVKDHDSWGVTEVFQDTTGVSAARFEESYREGKDAGTVSLVAPTMAIDPAATVVAGSQAGRNQRAATSALTAATARAFDEVPDQGTLEIDLEAFGRAATSVAVLAEAPEPLTDAPVEVYLPASLFAASGFGDYRLRTLGDLRVGDQVVADFAGGASVLLQAGSLDFGGRFSSSSGSFEFRTARLLGSSGDLTLRPDSSLDVSGEWVNDNPFLPGGQPLLPLWIEGGSVRAIAEGDFVMSGRSAIRANGGAHLSEDLVLVDGHGGAIELASLGLDGDTNFLVSSNLSAYALHHGGSVRLEANALGLYELDISQVAPFPVDAVPGERPDELPFPDLEFFPKVDAFLPSFFFSLSGFEDFELVSNRYGIVVAEGAKIDVRQSNYLLLPGFRERPSSASLGAVATVTRLEGFERRPANLRLRYALPDTTTDEARFGIIAQEGSALRLDPLAELTLDATGSIWLQGRLEAPGGLIRITNAQTATARNYIAGQQIFIEDTAVLDAAGTFIEQPNAFDLRLGDLLDGGRIEVNADIGFAIIEADALFDVSPASAEIDVTRSSIDQLDRVRLSSDAGSIRIVTAQGGYLGGQYSTRSDVFALDGLGGALTIGIDPNSRALPNDNLFVPLEFQYPDVERVLEIVDVLPEFEHSYGDPLPLDRLGIATARLDQLDRRGFDDLTLLATNVNPNGRALPADGRIRFTTDLDLTADRALRLRAPFIDLVAGAQVELASSYLQLGSDAVFLDFDGSSTVAGDGSLSARAELIDLVGFGRVSGAEQVTLRSAGDIRLRGFVNGDLARSIEGSFLTAGDLTAEAARIYATTLSRFEFGSSGSLRLAAAPAADALFFSYGSALTLSGRDVFVGGRVYAPGGSLQINASDTVELADGSVLSTALSDPFTLFGEVQGGIDWLYPLGNGNTLVFERLERGLIAIDSPSIVADAGSLIDASGGGDLLAPEFLPGPGGSQDFLEPGVEPGLFVIMPTAGLTTAAYDVLESDGFIYREGTGVALESGIADVPAGEYVVLPPRYALLPGALLVTPTNDDPDMVPGEVRFDPDGAPIIAGRFTGFASEQAQDRYQGFRIQPGSFALERSEIRTISGNAFFSADPGAASAIPADAGNVRLTATTALRLDGGIVARGADAAARPSVDGDLGIVAQRLAIIADDAAAVPDGFVGIAASALADFDIGALILGGQLLPDQQDPGRERLEVGADVVQVAQGVSLAQEGLVIGAREQVLISNDARLIAVAGTGPDGAGDRALLLGSDRNVVALSDDRWSVFRDGLESGSDSNATAPGVQVASGARLQAAGTAVLQSANVIALDGDLGVGDATVDLSAQNLALGVDPAGPDAGDLPVNATALRPESIAQLGEARRIALTGRQEIGLYGNAQIEAEAVTLDSGRIVGRRSDVRLEIAADDLRLQNSGAAAPALPEPTVGVPVPVRSAISLQARNLEMAGGTVRFDQLGAVSLAGRSAATVTQDQTLLVDGDLDFATARLQVDTAVDLQVEAAGAIVVNDVPQATAAAQVEGPAFGGSIALRSALGTTVATELAALSGAIELSASAPGADVSLLSGARLDVSGRTIRGELSEFNGRGGNVLLSSAQGSVSTEADSQIQLQGAGDAVGGTLTARAPNAQLDLAGGLVGGRGASVDLDAARLVAVDALNTSLNEGGFSDRRSLRQRQGDLVLSSDVAAAQVLISTDQGALRSGGVLTAVGDDATLRLSAGADLSVSGALVATGRDAIIELDALTEEARIDLRAPVTLGDGRLLLRVLADANVGNRVDIAAQGAERGAVQLELVSRRTLDGGQLETQDFDALLPEVTAEYEAAAASLAALADREGLTLGSGLWIDAGGDLTVNGLLDLGGWRFAQAPGRLLISSAGDLFLNGGISDGFREELLEFSGGTLPLQQLQRDASWGIELLAGRDPASAGAAQVQAGLGSLFLGSNSTVRTGTGAIRIRTGADLVLADSSATIYSAGVSQGNGGFNPVYNAFVLHGVEFPTAGGALDIRAGGNIVGASGSALFSEYLARFGGAFSVGQLPTMFGVVFDAFQQNIGSFGGGAVRIAAAGDIVDLSVIAPELLRHTGDATVVGDPIFGEVVFSENRFERLGGRQYQIDAGGSLLGGAFYAGSGLANIRADRLAQGSSGLAPILATSAAAFDVYTDSDLSIETVLNPTVLPIANSLQQFSEATFYFTYAPEAAVNLQALTGDLQLSNDVNGIIDTARGLNFSLGEERGLDIYPSSLRAIAATGSLRIDNDLALYPGVGGFEFFAFDAIEAPEESFVLSSDADPALLPNPQAPTSTFAGVEARVPRALTDETDLIHAQTPIHLNDPLPSTFEALTGSIAAGGATVSSAEAFAAVAAQDVAFNFLIIQNNRADDVSTIRSGGDIALLAVRDPRTGSAVASRRVIQVAGPGRLEVIAGRSVDLGTSEGIETIGDLDNPALADAGADVVVIAGSNGEPAVADFLTDYVVNDGDLRARYGERFATDLSDPATAAAFFSGLSAALQREIAFEVFFEELDAASAAASQLIAQEAQQSDIDLAYGRGEAAIAALFPESRDFTGDVSLFFSKINTFDGGDISVLVPGGLLNAGLASVSGQGLDKGPSDLGIVAQRDGDIRIFADGDIAVNRSRIFTLNGGDISIWSSNGNIDAGRGAQTALARPGLSAVLGENDTIVRVVPPEVSGSGIAADDGDSGRLPDILLSTPNGLIDAGDAGIRTPGRLFTAATDVVGRDNISVGGFVGAPADTVVLSADLASVGDSAASATQSIAQAQVDQDTATDESRSVADRALGWLEVFLEGFGPEFCIPDEEDDCSP